MAVRDDWAPGEILTATDLNDTFSAKADTDGPAFTGQMLAPDGDSNAPSYSWTNDSSSGIYFDSTNTEINIAVDYARYFGINSGGLITGQGQSLGDWQSWTPTFVNWSRGNGTFYCGKMELGRLVIIRFRFDMGSTTTYSGNLRVTGAPTGKSGGYYMTAACAYLDSSLSNSYNGHVVVNGTELEFYNNSATSRSALSSTVPFTWASGDLIYGLAVYEANADPS